MIPYTDTFEIPYGVNPRNSCENPTEDAKATAAEKALDEFIKFAHAYCHRGDRKCESDQKCNAHVSHLKVKNLGVVREAAGEKFNCKIKFEVSGDIFCDCGDGGDTVDEL
jgi:hypothetical protein